MKIRGTYWAQEMKNYYAKGITNTFVFHGNVDDYAEIPLRTDAYLGAYLQNYMKIKEIFFLNAGVNLYSPKTGYKEITQNTSEQTLFSMCSALKDSSKSIAYIIKYPAFLMPQDTYMTSEDKKWIVTLHETIRSVEFSQSNNVLIILAPSIKELNPIFISSNSRVMPIEIQLPTLQERQEFMQEYLKTEGDTKLNVETFAKLTAGLSMVNVEDIYLEIKEEVSLKAKDLLGIKKELIKKEHSEVVEFFDTSECSLAQFAGKDNIKEYFKDVVINAIKKNRLDIVPKGVLLMGPPGTGKTYFAKCLAGDAGMNFVEFKMSKILDKWVGNSEKALEKAFSVFRSLAPVGVFIDEIDQVLGRGNDSSKVSSNLFGMFLAELSKSENRGKIIWIGATNYPNKIDEALKRSGRFDKKIPFFAPDKAERQEVFKIHLQRTKRVNLEGIDLSELAEKTDSYTQAEIENVVVKATELAFRRRKEKITQSELLDALEYMSSCQNDKIKEMEDIAVKECNDKEFLGSNEN